MAWTPLAQGTINSLPLELFERSGEYMIRVDGLELMNSFCHSSEHKLAHAAKQVVSGSPNILIGGLGLGYTLSAFMDEFQRAREVTVVEKSADILEWYRKYFRAKVMRGRDDSNVRFIHQDICEFLSKAKVLYDLVVLDVDNGPEPVCGEENARLYNESGLELMRAKLNVGGALMVWSGFPSPEFERRAKKAGFSVETQSVSLPSPAISILFLCAGGARILDSCPKAFHYINSDN